VHRLTASDLLADPADELCHKITDLSLLPDNAPIRRLVDAPSWVSATDVVGAAEPLVHACLETLGDLDPTLTEDISSVLHLASGFVCTNGWLGSTGSLAGDLSIGLCGQLRVWAIQLQSRGGVRWDLIVRPLLPDSREAPVVLAPAAANYVTLAGLSQLLGETRHTSYVGKIERVATLLALSPSELARMLDVSREGLRRWLTGSAVAPDRWPTIDELNETVDQLAKYIKPDRLPAVVRRPADSLGGATPLDWLVARRYRDLLATYRRALSYQVPL
jgi:hypothetical protein